MKENEMIEKIMKKLTTNQDLFAFWDNDTERYLLTISKKAPEGINDNNVISVFSTAFNGDIYRIKQYIKYKSNYKWVKFFTQEIIEIRGIKFLGLYSQIVSEKLLLPTILSGIFLAPRIGGGTCMCIFERY